MGMQVAFLAQSRKPDKKQRMNRKKGWNYEKDSFFRATARPQQCNWCADYENVTIT
jgi:hypothetical protein